MTSFGDLANTIVSTDLDGTLLDHHSYSFDAARAGLTRCAALGIPVIINTSKTYAEVIALQAEIGLDTPLIVENGSALIAADNSWRSPCDQASAKLEPRGNGARQLVFGTSRGTIIDFIDGVRTNHDWKFEGFNDWSVNQIAEKTGLTLKAAALASRKEFSEPFVWHDSAEALTQFTSAAESKGLSVLQGGRFYHLQGNTDKAVPLAWLKRFGAKTLTAMPVGNYPPNLICLGDSHNDVAMLNAADHPVCVRSPVAQFPAVSTSNEIYYTQGFGPVGWSEAILSILAQTQTNHRSE